MESHKSTVSTRKGNDAGVLSGHQLRLAREQAHISLRSMAQRTGYSKGHLSNVETGTYPVTEQLVQRYQRALAYNEEETESSERREVVAMSHTQDEAWDIIIAGTTSALARKDRSRLEIEVDDPIEKLCKRMGLSCYKPSRFAKRDEQTPDLPAEYHRIVHAKVLVAYVGVNDSRTGLQLGWAHVAQIPIILIYEEGNSAIADEYRQQQLAIAGVVAFRGQDDLESKLSQTLFWLLSEQNLKEAARLEKWTAELTDSKLRDLNDLRRRGVKAPTALRPISEPDWLKDNPFAALEGGELQPRAR